MSTPESGREQRHRLVRSRRGRLIGGVCSGLADALRRRPDPVSDRVRGPRDLLGDRDRALPGDPAAGSGGGREPRADLPDALVLADRARRRCDAPGGGGRPARGRHAGSAGHRGAWGFGSGLGSLALRRLHRRAGFVAVAQARWGAGARERRSATVALSRARTAVVAWALLLAVTGAWLAGIDGRLAAWAVVAIGAPLSLTAFTGGARWLVLPAVAFALVGGGDRRRARRPARRHGRTHLSPAEPE